MQNSRADVSGGFMGFHRVGNGISPVSVRLADVPLDVICNALVAFSQADAVG